MAFNDYPFLRYAIFFILGILIYPLVNQVDLSWLLVAFASLFLTYTALTFYTHHLPEFKNRIFISFLGLTLWLISGVLVSHNHDVLHHPAHIYHSKEFNGYIGIALQNDEEKPRSFRNKIQITHIVHSDGLEKAEGEVILYHQSTLAPGQVVAIKGKPQQVAPPTNPHEFDYARFLSRQQIYHTHFAGKNLEVMGEVNHRPVNFFFIGLRKKIQMEMERVIDHPRAKQIAEALLLGQKNNLDKEVSQAYSTAGAMHILAVSGLHVGIIYGFFFMFFKPYKLGIYKRVTYLSIVILIIWVYAFLTGMSPSVMRSATMFTMVSLAQMRSRNPSIYNGLAISAILLLLYDPNLVYSVGFQLSYAALTGILLLQPPLVNVWLPKNKVLEKGWQITTVGIAAQLATFPISAYYFHTFPTYFILSNLIAIPGAFFIMATGLPFMLFSLVPWIGDALGILLDYLIRVLNILIFFIHDLPLAKITSIHIEPWEIAWYYGLLTMSFLFLTERSKYLSLPLISVLVLGVMINWTDLVTTSSKNEIYLYAVPGGRAVDYLYGDVLYSWTEEVAAQDLAYKVEPNRISMGITNPVRPLLYEQDQDILILPPFKIIATKGRNMDFLNFSPKEVALYDGNDWVRQDIRNIKWEDNKAYRIIVE